MITKLLSGEIRNINRAGLTIGILTIVSALFAVFRESLLAARFGAGDELDIYFAAFKIPDLVFNVIFFGAISAGFVPIFLNEERKSPTHAWEFVNNLLVMAIVAYGILGSILFVSIPWIMPLIAPGFMGNKLALTITLSRFMLLQPLFLGISAIFGGVLQARHKFFAYSLAPILYNIGIILGLVFIVPYTGIIGLGYGVILGGILHLILQWFVARHAGFKFTRAFMKSMPAVTRVAGLMTNRSLNLGVNQIILVAITFGASTAGSGTLATFQLSNNLLNFVVSAVGVSLAVASFPALTVLARDNMDEFRSFLRGNIFKVFFLLVPASAFAVLLREQLIRLVLGYGKFGIEDVVRTATVFGVIALGVAALGIIPLLIRAFFSLEDTLTPLVMALLSLLVTIIMLYSAVPALGGLGVALAFTAGNVVEAILLLRGLHVKTKGLLSQEFWTWGLRLITSTAFAYVVSYSTLRLISPYGNLSHKGFLITEVLGVSLTGGVVFWAMNRVYFASFLRGFRKNIVEM